MAADKDVFVPVSNEDRSQGKWVRYDAEGHMVKGEDYRYGGWYYFDPVTGEMAKGFRFVDSNGGKWVFYDYTTGQMAHGERYIDGSHGDEPGWMYFDDSTGAVLYGWRFLMSDVDFKWVYYDTSTGRMVPWEPCHRRRSPRVRHGHRGASVRRALQSRRGARGARPGEPGARRSGCGAA